MAERSKIEWTDATWNPIYGCTKVSPGCVNCYAEQHSRRFRSTVPFNVITLNEDKITDPLHWRRPRKIFPCSLSDLFHVAVPTPFRDRIVGTMLLAHWHTFQVLTKRPENALAYLVGLRRRKSAVGTIMNAAIQGESGFPLEPEYPTPEAWDRFFPFPNVWWGVSVESPRVADTRIADLQAIAAVLRFISFEPLIEPIPGKVIQPGIGWVIVGGESGPGCRPMEWDWARTLHAATWRRGAAFFMKQGGGCPNKRDKLSDFPADLRFRQFPNVQ